VSNDVALSVMDQLEACETVIRRGLATFVEVGTALATIRDERLYRESHETFEDYCREAWNFGRQRAAALIEAAGIVNVVSEISDIRVSTESHAAALAPIIKAEGPERAAEVLAEVAEAGPVTARAIRETGRPTRTVTVVEEVTVDAETGEIVAPTADEYVSQFPDMRKANLRKEFSRWTSGIAPTVGFDPEELAGIVGNDELKVMLLRSAVRRATEWLEQFDAAVESNRGLRLVKGSNQ